LELVVSDRGVGISPACMSKIDDPFFSTKSSGAGLGLAICRSIVAEMRGRMTLESQPEEGTQVLVRFPIPEAPSA
ncbi:MAG: ATP-binding protein, partial [Planctomycetales bacterium]